MKCSNLLEIKGSDYSQLALKDENIKCLISIGVKLVDKKSSIQIIHPT